MAFTPNGQQIQRSQGNNANSLPYGTIELIDTIENFKTPSTFLGSYFDREVLPVTEEVAIDIDVGKRRMAPFCSPLVEGIFVESRKFQTAIFKPPYIKDKRVPDLLKPVRRQIGERIAGDLDNGSRLEENLNYELGDQIDLVNRRIEWMQAQALLTGGISVNGEGYGYETLNIDFNRDVSLSVGLTGTATWDNKGSSPSACITQWAKQVFKKSGTWPTEIIFGGTKAFDCFKNDPAVKLQITQQAIVSAGVTGAKLEDLIELGGIVKKGGVYMGRWGQFNLWIYLDYAVHKIGNSEVELPLIPEGSLVMTSKYMRGTTVYGLIKDPQFNYQALKFAPKIWMENDPAQINLMMQSAPLPYLGLPNGSMSASVIDPGNSVTNPNISAIERSRLTSDTIVRK